MALPSQQCSLTVRWGPAGRPCSPGTRTKGGPKGSSGLTITFQDQVGGGGHSDSYCDEAPYPGKHSHQEVPGDGLARLWPQLHGGMTN